MERKLNEQWIEVIDGQEHMVKAIEPTDLCRGCLYNGNGGGCWWSGFDDECEMGSRFIIKDLGILNASGFLPIPFDVPDVYPKYPVINEYCRNIDGIPELFQVSYSHMNCHINFGIYNTKQQAIDAWNRRA